MAKTSFRISESAAQKPRSSELQGFLKALSGHRRGVFYVLLLGLKTHDARALHRQVQKGLPIWTLDKLGRSMNLSGTTVSAVLRIPQRTLHRRKEQGRLSPDESDRLVRLTRLLGRSVELFEGDVSAAKTWLETPLTALGGSRPLELAQTDPGVGEVEALIGRLEHGVFV